MPNDVRLQEGHPVDENLRPIKVGGKSTSLETAQYGNGARVNGDLEITGSVPIVSTNSIVGEDVELSIKSDRAIELNSVTGSFAMMANNVEFSASDSSYAGMMIGCTHVFGSGLAGTFVLVSTAWENLLWDTDKYALVTFVVPPSNRVKINIHLPWVPASGSLVQLGLATDSSATTLHTKYENDVDDANRSDSFNINYSWVVEGSDHSWSGGETKTIYIMAYTSSSVRFYTGGTGTSSFGGVIVEAIALPKTISDGSEP